MTKTISTLPTKLRFLRISGKYAGKEIYLPDSLQQLVIIARSGHLLYRQPLTKLQSVILAGGLIFDISPFDIKNVALYDNGEYTLCGKMKELLHAFYTNTINNMRISRIMLDDKIIY